MALYMELERRVTLLEKQLATVTAERDKLQEDFDEWVNCVNDQIKPALGKAGMLDLQEYRTGEPFWEMAARIHIRLASERDGLAAALSDLLEAASKVRHWHNTGRNDEGTIISSESWRALKEAEERCTDPSAILDARDARVRRETLEAAASSLEKGLEPSSPLLKPDYTAIAIINKLRRMAGEVKG